MMYTIKRNSELYHYGVKGMKWGVRRYQRPDGTRTLLGKARDKFNSPSFRRKAIKGAKIAAVVAAAYATHKIINNPKAIAVGKVLMDKALHGAGAVKSSVVNSKEFRIISAAKVPAKKVLSFVKSDDTKAVITGIGVMAGTASILRGQIRDLKNKPDGDRFDRAVQTTRKISDIGVSVNTLAKGPKAASSNGSSSALSSSIKGVKPSHKGVDKSSKEYQDLFKGQDAATRSTIKSLVSQGYDIEQIREHLKHSSLYDGYYIMHGVFPGSSWKVTRKM